MPVIVLFGPGPRFKGGIANYNTSLARAVDAVLADTPDAEVHIVSWTQQYPAIIPRDFIDRASRQDQLAGTRIQVHYRTNYNNPATWAATVDYIAALRPDRVVFQWAIALQGLPMGWMARRLMRRTRAEVVFDLHLVHQKEASLIDRLCTRYGLAQAHTYIVHAEKTYRELQSVFPHLHLVESFDGRRADTAGARTVLRLYHPVYDMFRPDPTFDVAAEKARLGLRQHVFLFFGFIRKYKGLHQCLQAFAKLAQTRDDVSLLIVGESFWNTLDQNKISTRIKQLLFRVAKRLVVRKQDDERGYNPLALVDSLHLRDRVAVVNRFVPNEEVHRYFQVSDAVLLFYENATPSGVESIGYNFHMPILATRVGHFTETVQDGYNGYLARAADTDDMAATMQRFLDQPIPRAHVAQTAARMNWDNYARVLLQHPGAPTPTH